MSFNRRVDYTYDSEGRITQVDIYHGTSEGIQLDYRYSYTYDAAGRITLTNITTPTQVKTITYTYDSDGQLVANSISISPPNAPDPTPDPTPDPEENTNTENEVI